MQSSELDKLYQTLGIIPTSDLQKNIRQINRAYVKFYVEHLNKKSLKTAIEQSKAEAEFKKIEIAKDQLINFLQQQIKDNAAKLLIDRKLIRDKLAAQAEPRQAAAIAKLQEEREKILRQQQALAAIKQQQILEATKQQQARSIEFKQRKANLEAKWQQELLEKTAQQQALVAANQERAAMQAKRNEATRKARMNELANRSRQRKAEQQAAIAQKYLPELPVKPKLDANATKPEPAKLPLQAVVPENKSPIAETVDKTKKYREFVDLMRLEDQKEKAAIKNSTVPFKSPEALAEHLNSAMQKIQKTIDLYTQQQGKFSFTSKEIKEHGLDSALDILNKHIAFAAKNCEILQQKIQSAPIHKRAELKNLHKAWQVNMQKSEKFFNEALFIIKALEYKSNELQQRSKIIRSLVDQKALVNEYKQGKIPKQKWENLVKQEVALSNQYMQISNVRMQHLENQAKALLQQELTNPEVTPLTNSLKDWINEIKHEVREVFLIAQRAKTTWEHLAVQVHATKLKSIESVMSSKDEFMGVADVSQKDLGSSNHKSAISSEKNRSGLVNKLKTILKKAKPNKSQELTKTLKPPKRNSFFKNK